MSKVHVVSFSELSSYRQCPHKHELEYKQRWRGEPGPALARGVLWHTLLEGHYRILQAHQRDRSMTDAELKAQLMWSARKVLVGAGEHADLLEWMYTGYLEFYGLDLDWKVLAVEHAPEVWLPTAEGTRSRFKIKLKIDLVIRWQDQLWIVDHKSGKELPRDKELDIDDQFGLYTWAMRQLGRPVFGSIHSAARTHRNKNQDRYPQPLDERFHRTLLSRTDRELDTIAVEAYRTARAAYRWADGEAPRSPNPDTCGWRCSFTEACLMGRKGADEQQILRDMGMAQDFERH